MYSLQCVCEDMPYGYKKSRGQRMHNVWQVHPSLPRVRHLVGVSSRARSININFYTNYYHLAPDSRREFLASSKKLLNAVAKVMNVAPTTASLLLLTQFSIT